MATTYGGRWKGCGLIAEAGQAWVHRVEDTEEQGKYYAMKLLKNPKRLSRFEREIEALQSFDHPSIMPIFDSGMHEESHYYVMELMKGNLAERAGSFKGDIQRSLKLLLLICDAVQTAQEKSIYHRDLKPENILFRDETDALVVADFGICFWREAERLTASSEAVGPRYFMAPELEGGRSDQVGPHNDVYSLGKLLYYIVSGGTLLPRERHREDEYELREKLTGGSLVSVVSCQLEYVSRLLDHMIAESVSERWATVEDCGRMIRIVLRLVEEGRYPITDNMPCRFCGIDKYHLMPKGSGVGTFSGQRYMYCLRCGHLENFLKETFESNHSIGGPPNDW
ncbi:MAG: serine/threonine protein kinase [Armatimonadota bacterium]|nr:MAG: serine/threonine protein kinase [Armatimonadota bacterium]